LEEINTKIVGTIRQWIYQYIYHQVLGDTLADNLWKRLGELVASKNSLKKAFLIMKLVNLKYKDGSLVVEHFSSFENMVNQLITIEIILNDELLALLLLSSLLDSYKTLVVSLSKSTPNGKLNSNMVKDSLLNKETTKVVVRLSFILKMKA